MLAHGKSDKPHLVIDHDDHGHHRRSPLAKTSDSLLPRNDQRNTGRLPAMADSALLLQVLLAGPVVNLRSIGDVIRNDVGLTVELFRLAYFENLESGAQQPIRLSIPENVIHTGVDRLRSLAHEIEPLTSHPHGRAALRMCEQFWGQARLTALMAEELAFRTPGVDAEEAYVAGLLFHLAELPALLGWELEIPATQTGQIESRQWRLPEPLQEIIWPGEKRVPATRRLLDLVRVADLQTQRIGGLVTKFARGVF